MRGNPPKQSWEEALEDEGTTVSQPREEIDLNSNDKIAADRENESATNGTVSEEDAPTEEVSNIEETNASQESNDGETGTQPTEASNQQNENHKENAQESPPPIPNASHNYSEGFTGDDASSTASDEQLGLDTASINQNAKTKAGKRRSERLGAKLPSSNKETTEKDAT